jgi:hypothetical protein
MRPLTNLSLFPFLLALPPALLPAQTATPAPATTERPAAEPLKVAIVGASLSAGFLDGPLTGGSSDNHTTALLNVVRSWLGDGGKVQRFAEVMMFTDPIGLGEKQMKRAHKDGADLLLALDFLFWYGYGGVPAARGEDETKARLARFELGLAHLAEWEGPVLTGDLPDMHGAAPRMLPPHAIPSVEALKALNERLASFAKERPNVHVLPLRAMVKEMKEKGVSLPLAAGAVQVPPGGMLQGDGLHPNRIGMAWLGYQLQDHVRAALPKERASALPTWTVDQFVAAAGADIDLGDLAAKAADPPAGKKK